MSIGLRRSMALMMCLAVLMAVASITAPTASAHHPEVEASVECVEGAPVVSYTATSWTNDVNHQGRYNSDIGVYVLTDGWSGATYITSGAFAEPDATFSGSFDASAWIGDEIIVGVRADADWGNGQDGGQKRPSQPLTIPGDCEPEVESGWIIVTKIVAEGDAAQSFDFDGAFDGELKDGQSSSAIQVEPGSHVVTEDANAIPDGWETPAISCDDENSSGSGWSATFNVESGETVECTFTNTYVEVEHPSIDIVVDCDGVTFTVPEGYKLDISDAQGVLVDRSYGGTYEVALEVGTYDWVFYQLVYGHPKVAIERGSFEIPECSTPTTEVTTPTVPEPEPEPEPEKANVLFSAACDDEGYFMASFSLPGASGNLDMDGDGTYGPDEKGLGSGTFELTGATYMWEATADPGHEFAAGTIVKGSGDTEVCAEVLGVTITAEPPAEVAAETLPFTGFETENTLVLGIVALAIGALMLFGTSLSTEEDVVVDATGRGWTSR